MIPFDFGGRHAVVTGAASGIGAGVALRLLAAGAFVTACDIDGTALDRFVAEAGSAGTGRCQARRLDVADHAQVRATFEALDAERPIDVLVHAAAIVGKPTPVAELDPADWQKVIATNLTGTFNVDQAAVRAMQRRGHGRILNFGSVAAGEGAMHIAAYNASKAGVVALTTTLAKETADQDIAVNCIVPAGVRTPMVAASGQGNDSAGVAARRIARGRLAEVAEVADAVLWLCAKENSFTTGQAFNFAGARA